MELKTGQNPFGKEAAIKPMKRKKTFVEEAEELFTRHGYRDWAVVVRRPEHKPEKWCAAGTGNPITDREALGILHFEVATLQDMMKALAAELERKPAPKPKNTEKTT